MRELSLMKGIKYSQNVCVNRSITEITKFKELTVGRGLPGDVHQQLVVTLAVPAVPLCHCLGKWLDPYIVCLAGIGRIGTRGGRNQFGQVDVAVN